MARDLRKIAAECWKKGTEAMSKENWDYAIDMFGKSVTLIPDNLAYRQTLRGCERKKYNNDKNKIKMAHMRLMGIRGKIRKARMKEDWKLMDQMAEQGLKVNPWDSQLNADMGYACLQMAYTEIAEYGYEQAVINDIDNDDFNRQYAYILEERGKFEEAILCWERVYKRNPLDSEARSKITHLQADMVMDRHKFEEAEGTRDIRKEGTAYDFDRPAGMKNPEKVDGPGMSLEADLQRAIRKEPGAIENYLKLGEYYKDEKRLDEAAEIFVKAVEVSGNDPDVTEQLEDIQLQIYKQNYEIAKEISNSNPKDAGPKKKQKELGQELMKKEIEVFSRRIQRYPKDQRMKYELAKRLMGVRQFSKAIPLLQQAGADTRIETVVLVALGECFIAEKKRDLARRQLDKAVPKLSAHDHTELFLKAHYLLGRIAEEADHYEKAEYHYGEVLAVDYDYRDTLQRLEKNQGQESADS